MFRHFWKFSFSLHRAGGVLVEHLEYSKIDAIIVRCEAKDKTFLSRSRARTGFSAEIVFVLLNRNICHLYCCCCCHASFADVKASVSLLSQAINEQCVANTQRAKLHSARSLQVFAAFHPFRLCVRIDDFCLVKFLPHRKPATRNQIGIARMPSDALEFSLVQMMAAAAAATYKTCVTSAFSTHFFARARIPHFDFGETWAMFEKCFVNVSTHLTNSCSWLLTRHDTTVAPAKKNENKFDNISMTLIFVIRGAILSQHFRIDDTRPLSTSSMNSPTRNTRE